MNRILIADDHAILRKGLKETIEEELGETAFGEAANGREVLEQVWKKPWDLVLLDIGMEGRSGLEVLEEIRSARPKLPVVMSAPRWPNTSRPRCRGTPSKLSTNRFPPASCRSCA